jgi:hypothetical protein
LITQALIADYTNSGAQGKLPWMAHGLKFTNKKISEGSLFARQSRHQAE